MPQADPLQASHDAPSYVRRHTPQISISDDNHHVTEAIGGMYGSDDDDYLTPSNRNSRPLSFVGSALETYQLAPSYLDTKRSSPPRSPLQQTGSNEKLPSSDTAARKGSLGSENLPLDSSSPPTLSRKSSSSADTAVQQFPLNDIDYESSPAAVAQELNNLQAIRRMSMSVDNADPDLPSFGASAPTSPEPTDDDEASRLFWVPARLHPELAPKEFKTFVEDRVDRIRKRSGSGDSLMPGVERSNSGSSLTRKKSMLSRQIDSSKGYEDGAERLQRKRSEREQSQTSPTAENLQELEGLVNNVGLDSARNSLDSGVQMTEAPILPPPGPALKRSTRTYMRKDRAPFSRRGLSRQSDNNRQSESDGEGSRAPSPALSMREPSSPGINRVQTEPAPARDTATGAGRLTSSSSEDLVQHKTNASQVKDSASPQGSVPVTTFHSKIATNGRTTAPIPGASSPIPQIVETPPAANSFTVPERKSSHVPPSTPLSSQQQQQQQQQQQHSAPLSHGPTQHHGPPRTRPSARGAHSRPSLMHSNSSRSTKSTLEDISSHPSPLPGSGNTRTDALTMVPTYEEKKVEKKDSRKTSWNWLLGSDEKDKEKERRTEDKEREKEAFKKQKAAAKQPPKTAEKTRLDVLQSSIDGNATIPKGRESLVLDRESFRLEEERKKESSRKSSDGRKDKDSGILSAIFGGGKRSKEPKQQYHAPKESLRAPSPEPAPRILRPDIDYNWTRFSILEERAIYRMAHMKLANPRRPLHSQVLLSNFMYSYLAKVQMYHPQSQVPVAQKTAQARQQQLQQQQQQQIQQQQQPLEQQQDGVPADGRVRGREQSIMA
ncbi:uncharacterized protein M437DRAFT_55197 [Aureobasidium melanogenum CBS 110374]|uniref:Protein Zds1 C-terminal domain-containing protein n=1 Tax=Aureobasidium melanogenum (strain CBS 110374) TaxID=1043003 RepID=A0A074VQX3_AURM1|nr:uncharacterized protein M437DRAFT_55197 [Aureobasidium melanogenum CBS 110374]KEQ60082.1 hypothetical protein M437DRAFT_55197 [Aureobasidium melanogenum CBS 110374]